MVVMLLGSLATTAALNAMFGLRWPLWGPAMFLAAAVAVVQSVLWLTERSGWIPVAVAAVGAVVGLWFKSRYGPTFSTPTGYWRQVTAGEVLTMLAAVGFAYAVGVAAVARNRRGEPPLSLGILAWLDRVLDWTPRTERAFRSSTQAQAWFEWRQKGWVMPLIVGFGILVLVGLWSIFNRSPEELFAGFVTGGGLLSLAGLIGALVVGNCGASDARPEMGPFLATRPLTTTEMARLILLTAGKSVLLAWSLWAAAFAVVYLILLATKTLPRTEIAGWVWWYFPATLLGCWTTVAVGASLGLMGRPALFVKLICGLFAGYIGAVILSGFMLSRSAQEQLGRGVAYAAGMAFLLATVWLFVAAWRRSLVDGRTVSVAASVWMVLAILTAVAWSLGQRLSPQPPATLLVLAIGVCALSVVPLAAAPLALACNRTR
jgi:hypothetical protein